MTRDRVQAAESLIDDGVGKLALTRGDLVEAVGRIAAPLNGEPGTSETWITAVPFIVRVLMPETVALLPLAFACNVKTLVFPFNVRLPLIVSIPIGVVVSPGISLPEVEMVTGPEIMPVPSRVESFTVSSAVHRVLPSSSVVPLFSMVLPL